jgi:monovalent cation:H+ antiporter-2, CPA2 family
VHLLLGEAVPAHGSGPPDILLQLVLLMAAAIGVVYALRQLRVPAVVGFLFTGVLLGPGGLGLVKNPHNIELLAEVGVVFLLFSIGLKFSLVELIRMRKLVLGAGGLQVAITVAITGLIAFAFGAPLRQAVLIGFLLAMSSTAIVLKLLEDQGQTSSLHGRFMIAVLIFQDLAVVPLMLLIPILGGKDTTWQEAAKTVLTSLGVVAVILASARWVFPWILERVVRTRSREIFTLTTFCAALGTAYMAGQAGMSLALGAFLAGLVISESDYVHQIVTEVAPLRDALSSLFFVSVGMLVQPKLFLDEPLMSVGMTLGVIGAKTVIMIAIGMALGFGPRVAVMAALGLSQIGEFSFVLASFGGVHGLLDKADYARFIGVSVLTMALTPLFMAISPFLSGSAQRIPWLHKVLDKPGDKDAANAEESEAHLEDHVLVVGYGVNGRNVVRVLRELEVKYLILELNPFSVRALRDQGEQAMYGDSTRDVVLDHAGIDKARVLVVAISDPVSARQTVAVARRVNPKLKIFVRARYVAEVDELMRLGATEVVPEEFETSLELCAVVMAAYGAPERVILREKEAIRSERSSELRVSRRRRRPNTLAQLMTAADVEEVVLPRGSPAIGQSLKDLGLRERTGASVIGVAREGKIIGNPGASFVLREDDVVFLFASAREHDAARAYLLPEGVSERLPMVTDSSPSPDA